MFTAFSLKIDDKEMLQLEAGKAQDGTGALEPGRAKEDKLKAEARLRECIDLKHTPNGDFLLKDWFAAEEPRVFLSHSKEDEALAYRFADWLYEEFGIATFLDSFVWEAADMLVQETGQNAGGRIPVLLNNELMKLVDHCECILFMNTQNAGKDIETRPELAWIYSEIEASRLITKKKPKRFKKRNFALTRGTQFELHFDEQFKNLIPLDVDELIRWHDRYKKISDNVYSLDLLYLHKKFII
ncbi:MAG: hypothetical protein RR614_09740 [Eubacterium sp.]